MYDKNIQTYSIGIGVDYLKNNSFFMSSEIGFQQIGGKLQYSYIENLGEKMQMEKTASIKYIAVNTLINVKLEKDQWIYYCGIGPALYYNINDKQFMDYPDIKSFMPGMKITAGVKYKFERLRLGVNCNYLPCFSNLSDILGKATTWGFAFSIGYELVTP